MLLLMFSYMLLRFFLSVSLLIDFFDQKCELNCVQLANKEKNVSTRNEDAQKVKIEMVESQEINIWVKLLTVCAFQMQICFDALQNCKLFALYGC